MYLDLLHNINLGKQVVGFLLTWRLLQPQLLPQMTDKYIVTFRRLVTLIIIKQPERFPKGKKSLYLKYF